MNNSISSSIRELPIRSEIYNCAFKNTNKVSTIIIIIIIIIISQARSSRFLYVGYYDKQLNQGV